jgi:hypothetical protein
MKKYKAYIKKNMILECSDYDLLKKLTGRIKKVKLEEIRL